MCGRVDENHIFTALRSSDFSGLFVFCGIYCLQFVICGTIDILAVLQYNDHIKNKGVLTMNIHFIRVGDYYIPDLTLPRESRPIGKWERMHRDRKPWIFWAGLSSKTLRGVSQARRTYLQGMHYRAEGHSNEIGVDIKIFDTEK